MVDISKYIYAMSINATNVTVKVLYLGLLYLFPREEEFSIHLKKNIQSFAFKYLNFFFTMS